MEEPSASSGGAGLGFGLVGLLAGGAALWLAVAQQADLEQLSTSFAIRLDAVATAQRSNAEALQTLAARVEVIAERGDRLGLSSSARTLPGAPAEALAARVGALEIGLAALKPAMEAAPGAPRATAAPIVADRVQRNDEAREAEERPAEPPPTVTESKPSHATAPASAPAAAAAAPIVAEGVQRNDGPRVVEERPAEPAPTITESKPSPAAALAAPEVTAGRVSQQSVSPNDGRAVESLGPAPARAEAARKPVQPATTAQVSPQRGPAGPTVAPPDGGPWVVVVRSLDDVGAAEQLRTEVARLGFPAELRKAEVKGQVWHRVVVAGYPSQQSARAAAAELGRRKLGSPWVLRSASGD